MNFKLLLHENIFSDPFDTHVISGWIAEYAFQTVSGDLYAFISMVFASFFIATCLHHCAFSKQFQALVNDLNDEIHSRNQAEHHQERHNHHLKIISMLCQLVRFHTSIQK